MENFIVLLKKPVCRFDMRNYEKFHKIQKPDLSSRTSCENYELNHNLCKA